MISPASRRDLELPQLLAVLAELASTDLGRKRLEELAPAPSRAQLEERRRLYDEVRSLFAEGRLVPELEDELAPVLEALRTGEGHVAGAGLTTLARLLAFLASLQHRLVGAEMTCPLLEARQEGLPDFENLRQRIERSFDRRGEVRDDATPRLIRLRRSIRRDRNQLHERLGEVVGRQRELLSEDTIAQRDGRLMVLLKAGSKGRADGLVHGRSASGQSFYFEPLEAVEANNALQQALADEQEERARIVRELVELARSHLEDLEAAADLLAAVDLQQALSRFADLVEAHPATFVESPQIVLRAARHPLLDPALAALREEALGQRGHRGEVVPLDLALDPPERALVITGPNAGGKTVALKTLGLLTLAAHCGIPIPAAEGSRLPFLTRLVAAIGDEQDLLEDRSTFSGRLLRLREAWQAAGERTLVLLDELGSGTDPEEGSALAIATLEGLLDQGCLVVLTTHLSRLAAASLDLPEAACAAMEFDAGGGRPTFRLTKGPPGGSEALALARRLELPRELLEAAEARLTSEHRDFRRLLGEVEALRAELARERDRLVEQSRESEALHESLRGERDALETEKVLVGKRMRRELEEFRQKTREQFDEEVERIRAEMKAGRKRNLASRAAERLFEEAPSPPEPEREERKPVVGGRVRHRSLGWEGRLERADRGRAEVLVQGKRLRCRLEELAGIEGSAAPPRRPTRPTEGLGLESTKPELHLLGQRVEEALLELDRYLDRALLASFDEVRVVHGHGTGRLKKAVRQHLAQHPAVATTRGGGQGEGGDGVTVARLRSG